MPTLGDTSVAEEFRYLKDFNLTFGQIGIDPNVDLEFSDSTKIFYDMRTAVVRLKKQSTGFYPTDADIWFRTWVTNPKAAREFLMVQIKGKNYRGMDGDTSWQVRLYDGTDHVYWDGAAWSVAGAGNWNTEAEVNANLSSFAFLPNRQFAIVVNLVTADKYISPIVREVKTLLKLRIDYLEDLIYRSLIPDMESQIRPLANLDFPALTSDTSSIDLDDYDFDTNFNIVDVEAVYDFTNDSDLLYNLLNSYDTGTKVITLTSTMLTGSIPLIVFRHRPDVIYTKQQDYFEVNKIPSIIINRIEIPTETSYSLMARDGIVDRGTGDAVVFKEPTRATLQFRLHINADKGVDLQRMVTSVMSYFDTNTSIRAIGTDESYRMQIIREYRDLITPKDNDELTFWTLFEIYDVKMPFVSQDTNGVSKLKLVFKEPKDVNEDPLLGGRRLTFQSHEEDGPFAWEETFEVTE
jgi:hypothetical protein